MKSVFDNTKGRHTEKRNARCKWCASCWISHIYFIIKPHYIKISIFKLHFHDDKLHLVEIHDELAVSILPGRWLGHGEEDRGRVSDRGGFWSLLVIRRVWGRSQQMMVMSGSHVLETSGSGASAAAAPSKHPPPAQQPPASAQYSTLYTNITLHYVTGWLGLFLIIITIK